MQINGISNVFKKRLLKCSLSLLLGFSTFGSLVKADDNNFKLICGNNSDEYIRKDEHVLKRFLARSEHEYLIHMANSVEYDGFDWNFYEMVDGKKETILDYLDMIFNDPDLAEDYDIPELKTLYRTIKQNGGKRGPEL